MPAHRSLGHCEVHIKSENHTLLARLCTGHPRGGERYSRSRVSVQKAGADLFTLDGLLTMDYYSKWLSIAPLHDTKSIDVIRELKRIFADFGSPEIVVTDGGPQFVSHEFRRFASDWLVQHTMSSPAYPRSNGQAERMVQTAKNVFVNVRRTT